MRSRRSLLGTAACAIALALTGTFGTAQAAQIAPAAPSGDLVDLVEFKTTGDAGYFYTTNSGEAATATSKHKFTKNNGNGVIGKLHSSGGPGRNAVHRLRLRNGGPSYMLSISPSEWRDGKFQDEGVLGYTDGAQKGGETRLMRFSNHGKWRAFPDDARSVQTMKDAGWNVDGPLGWYQA